mgnify:CR=1 FL=1|jgi:hypothetical protein|tara:strand:+ start:306 stop:497 length:192 start_codon:yes stop_codon:yes gene_type:complete
MLTQIFNHPELGPIKFLDKNEQTPSAKAKSHDINLIVSLRDRQQTAEIKQMIADDINNPGGLQ